MKMSSLLVIVVAICGYSLAQSLPRDETGVRTLMTKLGQSRAAVDAQEYASVFETNATWDGPLGQNAIGPINIRKAAALMFASFGPLQTIKWHALPLSAEVVMIDLYQKPESGRVSANTLDVPIADGSVLAEHGTAVRTTLIAQRRDGTWRVLAARIADIRTLTPSRPAR